MESLATATLTTVFSDVLAKMAFMFTEEDQPGPSSASTWMETTISYRGPTTGTLTFLCTSEFGVLLAASLLGIAPEDEDAEAKAQDAIKEFMNIVCGQFITAIHGTEHAFDLTIPRTRELTKAPAFDSSDRSSGADLTVEGHRVQLSYAPDHETYGR